LVDKGFVKVGLVAVGFDMAALLTVGLAFRAALWGFFGI
jgi:hypothetical protein